jgi:cytidine deaminase
MEFINNSDLTKDERELISKAFEASKFSISKNGHKVGCAILCENKDIFIGAVNERTKAIGSTCAERMAVDQIYFHGNKKPTLCVLVGIFQRNSWSDDFICTPCGVCLEMFFEMAIDFNLDDLSFLCPNWNKTKFLRIKLSELYPQIGKGRWKRNN